jgi:hypothetical protein
MSAFAACRHGMPHAIDGHAQQQTLSHFRGHEMRCSFIRECQRDVPKSRGHATNSS